MDRIIVELTNESRWIAPSVAVAIATALVALRSSTVARAARVGGAMNVFAGVLVTLLAFGHLLAVSLELATDTLEGRPVPLVLIGVVLLVPAVLVAHHGSEIGRGARPLGGRTKRLNLALVVALMLTGPLNLPLGVPALFNLGYAYAATRLQRLLLATGAAVFGALLLIGAIRFFASGASFEEFGDRGTDAEVAVPAS